MPKLTDTQLIILSTAGQRDGGAVLPLPKSLKLQGGAANHVLKSLLNKGLLDEQPAGHDGATRRESKDGQRLMLIITDVGRQAIGVAADEQRQLPPASIMPRSSKRSAGLDVDGASDGRAKAARGDGREPESTCALEQLAPADPSPPAEVSPIDPIERVWNDSRTLPLGVPGFQVFQFSARTLVVLPVKPPVSAFTPC